MEHEGSHVVDNRITLASTADTPFRFTVTITGNGASGSPARSFSIMGPDLTTGSLKVCEYRVPDREHNSFLDLFQNLARDFGTRLPRNRRPADAPTSEATYHALLTENLDPRILYGYGDPAVLRVEESGGTWYYLVVTSNDAPNSFPIIRSRDLSAWEFVGFVFPEGKKPEWAADGKYVSDFWAPEMHLVGDEFRVYFAARHKDTLELSIGVAKCASPTGPFTAEKEPLLTGNTIDPHVFAEEAGNTLLYWKEDNNDIWPSQLTRMLHDYPNLIVELFVDREDQITASFIQTLWPWIQALQPIERFFVQQVLIEAVISTFSVFRDRLCGLLNSQGPSGIYDDANAVIWAMRTPIYAQRLSADGLNLVGERIKVIENDQAWEAHLIEGVWLAECRGKYYLFYAGNDFSTVEYGIGVAIGDSPLGPYRKMTKPLLGSTREWSGPGHPSIAAGPDGTPLLFFHAFLPERSGYKEFRALLVAPIEFEADRVLLK